MKGIRRRKFIYILKITWVLTFSAALLFAGGVIVSVNCHKIVSDSEMVIFDVDSSENGITVTFLNKEYVI